MMYPKAQHNQTQPAINNPEIAKVKTCIRQFKGVRGENLN